MYAKPCLPALVSAITLGLATGGYAQNPPRLHTPPVPVLLSPSQILKTEFTVKGGYVSVNKTPFGPQPFVTAAPIYSAFNDNGFVTDFASAKYQTGNPTYTSSILDDFDLPADSVGTTGATMQTIQLGLINEATTTKAAYITIRIYDTVDFNVNNVTSPTSPPYGALLGSYTFNITTYKDPTTGVTTPGLPAGSLLFPKFTLPTTGTPVMLKHDLGTANEKPYGIQVLAYTSNARTTLSQDISFAYQYGAIAPEIGHSEDFAWGDFKGTGVTGAGAFYFGGTDSTGTADPANIEVQIVGSTPNPLTYEVYGTLTFPTLPAPAANATINVDFTFTSATVGVAPVTVNATLPLGTVTTVDPNTGATTSVTTADYDIIGVDADTYDIDISPDHFIDQVDSGVAVLTANQFGINATFTAPAFIAAGTIAFPNLVATAPDQTVNVVIHSETTNTNTTKTLTIPAAGGPFKFNLAPDKYTIWMKSPLDLAVKQTGLDLTASDNTALVLSFDSAGDTDNNNTVDVLDFGNLVNAYGSKKSVATSGYDATVDFNGDASVDVLDFGILVNSYGAVGPVSP